MTDNSPEQIINILREAKVLISRGQTINSYRATL
jgi:hypothetical protein